MDTVEATVTVVVGVAGVTVVVDADPDVSRRVVEVVEEAKPAVEVDVDVVVEVRARVVGLETVAGAGEVVVGAA